MTAGATAIPMITGAKVLGMGVLTTVITMLDGITMNRKTQHLKKKWTIPLKACSKLSEKCPMMCGAT